MDITLKDIGRRFGRDWIFRGVNLHIPAGSHTIITGPNGSGKSTLLMVLTGFMEASEGSVLRSENGVPFDVADAALKTSIATPYLELYEDLTLIEMIEFQAKFRSFVTNLSNSEVIRLMDLEPHANKRISHFSSGMRQRVRLALTILTDSSIIALDEPVSNLDRRAIEWYRNLLGEFALNRTVVVSTNHNEDEYLRSDIAFDVASAKI